MILYFPVNVKTLFELARDYPWIKPDRCPRCKGIRLWGHGYVERYFEGFNEALWVKRYRCPDCESVHTIRPEQFWVKIERWFKTVMMQFLITIPYRQTHVSFITTHSIKSSWKEPL